MPQYSLKNPGAQSDGAIDEKNV